MQVWAFGSDLTLIALGGEVVVDYARRLAREFPGRRLWVAGYSNDVFGYVPSLRVLREGGYEGGDAMIYYGRPAPFTDDVEELIVAECRRLVSPRRSQVEIKSGARSCCHRSVTWGRASALQNRARKQA